MIGWAGDDVHGQDASYLVGPDFHRKVKGGASVLLGSKDEKSTHLLAQILLTVVTGSDGML